MHFLAFAQRLDSFQVTSVVFIVGWILLYIVLASKKSLWVLNGLMIRGAILGITLVYLVINSVNIFVSKFNKGIWTDGGDQEGNALMDLFFILIVFWLWFHFAKVAKNDSKNSDLEDI